MTTLEVLMKTEKSLLDESIPFNFDSFYDCTCGHILRAVEGTRGYAGWFELASHPEYRQVIQEVAVALGYKGKPGEEAIYHVSTHTAMTLAGSNEVTRKDALNTVRTAMLALQPEEVQTEEYATA